MRILDLTLKDLTQIVRDWKSALFVVAMPILFTLFFGLVFHPGGDGADYRPAVGVVIEDQADPLAAALVSMLDGSGAVRPAALGGIAEAEDQVAGGDLAAALVVPAGWGEAALAGQEPALALIVDEGAAAGQTARSSIETAALRLRGAVETARISADAYAGQVGFESEAAQQAYLREGVERALARWQAPPLSVSVERAVAEPREAEAPSGFEQSSPGMMVQFAVFGLITSAMVLLLERKSGALRRLLTTPIRRAAVIAGHVLAMFLVALLQLGLLVAVGQLVFGVNYAGAPLATLLMVVSLALWAACLGLFIGAISRTEEQVITVSLIAMFLFSALGGAWFPLEVAGKAFGAIGHTLPTAWAMDGLQNIVVRGQGLAAVLLPAGVLLAYAVGFFGLAVWRFRFE